MPEEGTAKGSLQGKAVQGRRTRKTGRGEPNWGSRVRKSRQGKSLQKKWPEGDSMKRAVREKQDEGARSGGLWQGDAKGETLKEKSYREGGFEGAK